MDESRFAEAELLVLESINPVKERYGPKSPKMFRVVAMMAQTYDGLGRPQEATRRIVDHIRSYAIDPRDAIDLLENALPSAILESVREQLLREEGSSNTTRNGLDMQSGGSSDD